MTDDWDDEPSSSFGGAAMGCGFGRGRGGSDSDDDGIFSGVNNNLRGFGRGRGRGRRERGGGFDTNNNFGKKNDTSQMNGDSGGFGKSAGFGAGRGDGGSFGGSSGDGGTRGSFGSKGGFGGSNGFGVSSTNGDDWGDGDPGNIGGFDNKGGFGGGGGFSGGRSNDEPRGGGFGGGRSGGFGGDKKGGCYKCGEDGHMARDCPSAGSSGGGSRACFKCGQEGHMSRDCPTGGGGRGGGSRACYKCNEEGHMARDCPTAGGGGGGGSRACYKCNEEGHMARDCPTAGGGGGGGSRACYKCNEEGHMARDCPGGGSGGGGGGFGGGSSGGGFGGSGGGFGKSSGGFGGGGSSGGGSSNKCFKCQEEGHISRDCPQGGGGKGCFKCGEEGHMSRECPKAGEDGDKPREVYIPPAPPEEETEIFLSMQKGINFDKYDKIPVEVTGDDAPKRGIESFDDAELHEVLRENVNKAKYDKPTPVQKFAIPIIMQNRDLMACAQTGSGKTAAFLLPVLSSMIKNGLSGSSFSEIQEPQAIVIGPTRELVNQIYGEARKFSYNTMLRPVVVYGGTSVGHQLRLIEQGAHMVVGTPGRLADFINRGKISLKKVKFLILDEADRMLDMGFEPEVRKIVETMGMPGKLERQTLMFSATFPEEIQKLAADFLNRYVYVTVGRVGGANTDITQTVFQVGQYEKRDKLVSILNETGNDRTLVFVELKRNADFLASYLSQNEFPTTSIHGDRLQREREEALRDFKSGRAPILVATSVAARGLDIPGVQHVINYDMPKEIDEYVHRIGRTGRCGNTGKATSFFDSADNGNIARPLVKILTDAQQEVPDWLEEAAQSSFGAGGFTNVGGKYGGRDTRRGKFGGNDGDNSGGGYDGANSGGGFGGGSGAAADEEESWD